MKIILGGGLVALLARDILGDSWTLLPMGRSIYYSFSPPLADNHIIKDEIIDDYMDQYALIPIYYRVAYSLAGQLTYNHHIALDTWLSKIYGNNIPPQAKPYWLTHTEYFSYGDCGEIYRRLQDKYKSEIYANNEKWGRLAKIDNHTIVMENGSHIEYDEMISTIPLYGLIQALGIKAELPSKDLFCYHLKSDSLDFEGADQLLVVDPEIEFYKATRLNHCNYLIFAAQKIEQPASYFMGFMKRFELIGEVQVPQATPCGLIPEFKQLADNGITCIGSNAAWDDCMDVGSCCKRLIRKANLTR